MSSDIIEEFFDKLEKDERARQRLLEILRPYDYVKRDELALVLEEIKKLREDSNKRFEQIDKRFEQIDKRFEQMDKRFEQVNKRFEQIDKRFEQIDKRFEEMIEAMREGFKAHEIHFVILENDLADISSKYGKRAEDALRKLLAEVLEAEGIVTANIKHVQLIDEEGKYFLPGYTTDIDIYYRGKEVWLIEYKARVKKLDILKLVKIGQLARDVYKMKNAKVVLVALNINDELKEMAEKNGIKVIIGNITNPVLLPPP